MSDLKALEDLLKSDESEFKHFWGPTDIKYFGSSNRTIAFFEGIEKESALVLISQLYELDKFSDEPIYLVLNTEGGDVDSSLAILDCIKGLNSPVICLTTGICASGGLIVLSACDYRIATENCLFFYHQPIMSSIDVTSTSEIKSVDTLYTYYQIKLDQIIKDKTKMNKKKWSENFEGKTSFYFDAKQALDFGFIDLIDVPPPKTQKIKIKRTKKK